MNRLEIDEELERAARDFHRLLDTATSAELRAPANGTTRTNKRLLFHMWFGFILARVLLSILKGFSRLPPGVSRTFAAILNAANRPFLVVNYLTALPGGMALSTRTLEQLMDRTIAGLRRGLARTAPPT